MPIRDNIPSRRIPWLNYLLLAANVAVFLYQTSLPAREEFRFIYSFGLVPARFSISGWAERAGLPAVGYLPFLTAIFLHGGWGHLISNMWSLWLFGDNVEDRLGPGRFLLLYLGAGIAANILQYYINLTSRIPTIGASGAIAGVMGAYFLLYPRARIITLVPLFFYPFFFEVPASFYLLLWFFTQIFYAGLQPAGAGGVAWWAHIGGFLAGMIGVVFLKRRSHYRPWYEDEYRPW
ncbi:MAG: rhomboid family intramembrane serine protease [Firmicutes bacterium]|nr:rhomboid family intramembrane serine protease [Bacillota bacterium]